MNKVEQQMVPLYHVELVRDTMLPYHPAEKEQEAADIFHHMLDSAAVEKLAVIHCNSGGQMIGAEIVAMGRLESVGSDARDILRGAIVNGAASIWLSHNHVDGVVKASLADFGFTVMMEQACALMGMRLNDHLVVGPGGKHYSIYKNWNDLHQEMLDEEIRRRFGTKDPIREIPSSIFESFLGQKK